MTRFLHTSDWQLGITRDFLNEGARELFAQARIDAIRRLGAVARERGCAFLVVSGDVFESNQVDRRTVARAAEALGEVPLPIYLLPGNHDPLNEGSVYNLPLFGERKPGNVTVIRDERPIEAAGGVEIVGAPWRAKKLVHDTVAAACSGLGPADNLRICVAHGMVDRLSPAPDSPGLISLANAESLLAGGVIHYIALGDRHSAQRVGESGRAWYSGSPEPTAYDEVKAGFALVVDLERGSCRVEEVPVGTWKFIEERVPVDSDEDLQALQERLEGIPAKERTVLKLRLEGSLNLARQARLDELLLHHRDLLGALETREDGLVVAPEESDFSGLALSGFARKALESLREKASGAGEDAGTARDALRLLVRLSGGAA